MRVNPIDTSNLNDIKDFSRFASICLQNIITAVNGKISFVENVDANLIGATFTVANANVSLVHGLNRPCTGYFVTRRSTAMIIYDGSVAFDKDTLTIKSNAVGNASLLVF